MEDEELLNIGEESSSEEENAILKDHWMIRDKSQKVPDSSNSADSCIKEHALLLKYCQWISKHFWISQAFVICLHVTIIMTTGLLLYNGYSVFPIYFENLPLVMYHDDTYTKDMAFRYRTDFSNRTTYPITSGHKSSFFKSGIETLEIILEGSDMLSESNLQLLNKTEFTLFYQEDYQKHYCTLNALNECQKPVSLIRFFDGSLGDIIPMFNNVNFSKASEIICFASQVSLLQPYLLPLLEKGFDPCDSKQTLHKTRIFISYGWNFDKKYNDGEMVEYLVSSVGKELQNLRDTVLKGKLSLSYMSIKMFLHDVQTSAFVCLKLAACSLLFIFIFMWVQTTSFWITFFGILSIGTSFLLTNLIYRFVLGYQYFGFFHLISMFVVLGIGADDVFIFCDTWMLSKHTIYLSKAHRLADCYRKAAKTTFVTSLTTMTAFFVSAFSPLLPVSSFGIFTGMLIGTNYLFDLVCCPIVIIVYSNAIQPMISKCCPSVQRKNLSVRTEDQESLIVSKAEQCLDIEDNGENENGPRSNLFTENTEYFDNKNRLVLYFSTSFYNFMTWRPTRIVLPLSFLGCSAFFAYNISTLRPDSNPIKVFKESQNYGRALKLHYNGFKENFEDEYTKVHLSWGLKPRNLENCEEKSSSFCIGESALDDTFGLESEEAQVAIMKSDGEKVKFPFTTEYVRGFMMNNSHIYNMSSIPEDFDRYFEVLVTYWLTNGYSYTETEDYHRYGHLIGEQILHEQTVSFNRSGKIGMFGTRLRFIAVEINTTLSFHNLGYPEGKPVYELWEKFTRDEISKMPKCLSGGFQSTEETWHLIKVQEILANSAVRGLIIGISLALPILTLTTCNIAIGLLATLCIALITVVVVGLIPLIGWKLGVLESINLSLVVGLAVDYVVHFAEAYRTAPFSKRKERVKSMLEHMGISVLSGAITTFGAAVFMLFSEIQFSFQFGIFVMSTVGISFLFSLLFFTTFMATFGPEGDTGSIRNIFYRVISYFSNLKKENYIPLDDTYNNSEENIG